MQAAGILSRLGFPNIYNITILYYKISPETGEKDFQACPTPRILDFLLGKFAKDPWHIVVTVEKISLLSLGMSRKNLEKWLEKTWFLKDNMIAQYILQEQENEKEPAKEEKRIFHRRRHRHKVVKN